MKEYHDVTMRFNVDEVMTFRKLCMQKNADPLRTLAKNWCNEVGLMFKNPDSDMLKRASALRWFLPIYASLIIVDVYEYCVYRITALAIVCAYVFSFWWYYGLYDTNVFWIDLVVNTDNLSWVTVGLWNSAKSWEAEVLCYLIRSSFRFVVPVVTAYLAYRFKWLCSRPRRLVHHLELVKKKTTVPAKRPVYGGDPAVERAEGIRAIVPARVAQLEVSRDGELEGLTGPAAAIAVVQRDFVDVVSSEVLCTTAVADAEPDIVVSVMDGGRDVGDVHIRTAASVTGKKSYLVGPCVLEVSHFDTKAPENMLAAAATRFPTRRKIDLSSPVYARYLRAGKACMDHWFDEASIRRAYNHVLEDIANVPTTGKPKSWTADNWEKVRERVGSSDRAPMTLLQLKSEMVVKTAKGPRFIWNDGRDKCARNAIRLLVYERILFYCSAQSNIKHYTEEEKLQAVENYCNSEPVDPFTGQKLEMEFSSIDQTNFDMSEDFDPDTGEGLLKLEVDILMKIGTVMSDINCEEGRFAEIDDLERGKPSKAMFNLRDTCNFVKMKKKKRHSGDRGTSSLNFLVELVATLACHFKDPEKFFVAYNKKGVLTVNRCWNGYAEREGDRRPQNPTWLGRLDCAYTGKPIWFRIFIEGDDGLLWKRALIGVKEAMIVAEYAKLGLDTKLDTTSNGRAEFAGVHLAVKNGRAIYVMPDVMRALKKAGYVIAGSLEEAKNIGASAMVMKACSFAGRVDWMCDLFLGYAEKLGAPREIVAKVRARNHVDVVECERAVSLCIGHPMLHPSETYPDFTVPPDNPADLVRCMPGGIRACLA